MEEWGETYHSVHGAVQEALHVYIRNGFNLIQLESFAILEMGFGTGLNTFLTYLEAKKEAKNIEYHTIEAFPLTQDEVACLNYKELSHDKIDQDIFDVMHQSSWNQLNEITPTFSLKKIESTFEEVLLPEQHFDLIYFDAFGYPFQPELWSDAIFQKMYNCLRPGGVLTTYACRGPIKRAMKNAGFTLKFVAGPPGKREMTIAFKAKNEEDFFAY